MPKIVAFAGSTRKDSYNRRLVRIAAEGARRQGADVEVLELNQYQMPVMNEDLEAEHGMPEAASRFKSKLLNCDGFMISSPEYNGSIPPLLKNVLDWASRSEDATEKPLMAYKGKYAVIMSASPGSLGGIRGLVPLRMLLGNLGVLVLPWSRSISGAHQAFDEDGSLLDKKQQNGVLKLGETLADVLRRSSGG